MIATLDRHNLWSQVTGFIRKVVKIGLYKSEERQLSDHHIHQTTGDFSPRYYEISKAPECNCRSLRRVFSGTNVLTASVSQGNHTSDFLLPVKVFFVLVLVHEIAPWNVNCWIRHINWINCQERVNIVISKFWFYFIILLGTHCHFRSHTLHWYITQVTDLCHLD